MLTIRRAFGHKNDKDQLHLPRKIGGKDLINDENCVTLETVVVVVISIIIIIIMCSTFKHS